MLSLKKYIYSNEIPSAFTGITFYSKLNLYSNLFNLNNYSRRKTKPTFDMKTLQHKFQSN